MAAIIIYRKKEIKVSTGITIRKALYEINVPETVLPTRSGTLVHDDEILKDGDIIRLVPVITGG